MQYLVLFQKHLQIISTAIFFVCFIVISTVIIIAIIKIAFIFLSSYRIVAVLVFLLPISFA